MLINTLVVAILTSYRWPMGDEGKQAMLQGGVAGPPPYPFVHVKLNLKVKIVADGTKNDILPD